MMDAFDHVWLTAFSLLLLALVFVNYLIIRSIRDKPLGNQSIFDQALQDTFAVMTFYGSYACLICLLARFQSFREFVYNCQTLLTTLSCIYSFAFTCLCSIGGCLCIVRIISIANLSLLEETIGERKVRLISCAITLGSGTLIPLVYVIHEDINTGTPIALLTAHMAETGKHGGYFLA